MSEQIQIEPLGDGDYLIRARYADGVIESRFRTSQEVLEMLAVDETREAEVVEESAAFLTERQPVIDLPPMVDLDDVAVAYDDYAQEITRRLAAR